MTEMKSTAKVSSLPEAIFIVGLAASGKSTLARNLLHFFRNNNIHAILFDGDEMNEFQILGPQSGDYSIEAREQKAIQLKKLVCWAQNQELIPIVAVIGQPLQARENWKNNIRNYVEIYLKSDINTCKNRDYKGTYDQAENVIGVNIPFNEPTSYDLQLSSDSHNANENLSLCIDFLKVKPWISKQLNRNQTKCADSSLQ